jgi:hypothetical protein
MHCNFLAYTGVCPEGTDAEISRRESNVVLQTPHKSLSEYVDEVKSKHLFDADDYAVSNPTFDLKNALFFSSVINPFNRWSIWQTRVRPRCKRLMRRLR